MILGLVFAAVAVVWLIGWSMQRQVYRQVRRYDLRADFDSYDDAERSSDVGFAKRRG